MVLTFTTEAMGMRQLTEALKPFDNVPEMLPYRWLEVENSRLFVRESFSLGIEEILEENLDPDEPIIEIGSGVIHLKKSIDDRLIRLQPESSDYYFLKDNGMKNSFQINISDFTELTSKINEKIHSYFALNVFDTLERSLRRDIISKIENTQISGDKFIILQSTNAYFEAMTKEIYDTINKTPVIYLPEKRQETLLALLENHRERRKTYEEVLSNIKVHLTEQTSKKAKSYQAVLKQMVQNGNVQVIGMEAFYQKTITNELENAGYNVQSHYFCKLVTEMLTTQMPDYQLLYHPIAGASKLIEISHENIRDLHDMLKEKKIKFPKFIDANFLKMLKEHNQVMQAAEFLVIIATKI